MSNVIKNWLVKQNIDISHIRDGAHSKLLRRDKINPITSEFGVYHEPVDDEICIADILGIDEDGQTFMFGIGNNVFEELGLLFGDDKSHEYSSRCNSLLDYPKDELLAILTESFRKDPMIVRELEKGKYIISGNGKHRFTLLKALYLAELASIDPTNNPQQLQELRKKYTIPIKSKKLDYSQTYSNFFISLFGFYDISSTIIRPNSQTSSVVFKGQRYESFKDVSLIEFAKKIIKENINIFSIPYKGTIEPGKIFDYKKLRYLELQTMAKSIPQYYKTLPSFRKYINDNMKDFFLQLQSVEKSDILPDIDE